MRKVNLPSRFEYLSLCCPSNDPGFSHSLSTARKVDLMFPNLASISWSLPSVAIIVTLTKYVNSSTLSVGPFASITVCVL